MFDDVLAKVARVLEHRQLAWQTQMLRREVERDFDFDHLVGKSAAMREVFHLIRKVAPTQTTVLITGESGTGKEVVARAIHHYSQAAGKVFLPVNCAAIPETLLESQLFGHVRGAFTGAVTAQEGLFARASGGTIFLDEIGDLPLGLQSKLLRAIEGKEILPVGSTQPITVDVRIITATEPRPEADGGGGHVPRGPLLPPERRRDPPAAAARPARGHPRAGRVPRAAAQPRDEAGLPRRRQRDDEAPACPSPGRATSASSTTPSSTP